MAIASDSSFISIKYRNKTFSMTPLDLYSLYSQVEYKDQIKVKGYMNMYSQLTKIDFTHNTNWFGIKTHSRKSIFVSGDQSIQVLKEGNIEFVKANELYTHDTIFNNSLYTDTPNFNSKDFRLGQLIGIIAGDGSITSDYYIRVSINYEQTFISDFLKYTLTNDFNYTRFSLNNGNRCYSFDITGKKFTRFIKNYFIGNNTYTKHVSRALYQETFDFWIGFLDGLMVTDGSYNTSTTISLTNKYLIDQAISVLLMLGIKRDSIFMKSTRSNRKDLYKLNIPLYVMKFLPLFSKKVPDTAGDRCEFETFYYGHNAYKVHAVPYRFDRVYRYNSTKRSSNKYKEFSWQTDVIDSVSAESFNDFMFDIKTESGSVCVNNLIIAN